MLIVLFATFFILLLLKVPVSFSLFFSSVAAVLYGGYPTTVVIQRAITSVDSFTLLAVPFFMVAGAFMAGGSISNKLMAFAGSSVGWIKGGLAQINVVTSMIFAGITGSAVADTSSEGSIIIPIMKKEGYSSEFSAAITASSSVIGVIIPPSVPFVIYGVCSGVSIGKLFLGGIIPGLLIGLSQMGISYYYAKKYNYGVDRKFSFKEILKSLKEGWFALIMPLIIIGGVLTGVVTATEAAVVSILYALFIGVFIYKDLEIKKIPSMLLDASKTAGVVMFMIAGSSLYGWIIASEQLPKKIAEAISQATNSATIVMLFIVAAYLLAGMFLDVGAAIILITPILLPVATQFGIDPLVFGIVTVMTLAVGLITPPVGACLFIASSIADIPMLETAKKCVPFILGIVLIIVMIIFFPQIALFIPNLMIS